MKTLKLFFVTMLVLFLAVGISSAQVKKTVTTESWPWEGIQFCTNDYVTGEETLVTTVWNGKIQWRYKGTYTGESGKSYSWSLVVNYSWKDFVEETAYTETYVSTAVIECEGVPIALYKIRYHLTVNANGEIPVQIYKDSGADWICL